MITYELLYTIPESKIQYTSIIIEWLIPFRISEPKNAFTILKSVKTRIVEYSIVNSRYIWENFVKGTMFSAISTSTIIPITNDKSYKNTIWSISTSLI